MGRTARCVDPHRCCHSHSSTQCPLIRRRHETGHRSNRTGALRTSCFLGGCVWPRYQCPAPWPWIRALCLWPGAYSVPGSRLRCVKLKKETSICHDRLAWKDYTIKNPFNHHVCCLNPLVLLARYHWTSILVVESISQLIICKWFSQKMQRWNPHLHPYIRAEWLIYVDLIPHVSCLISYAVIMFPAEILYKTPSCMSEVNVSSPLTSIDHKSVSSH